MASSTQKGDAFESLIHSAFERQIKEGTFCIRSDCCEIFRKKSYYSRDRNANIIFDVSIEVRLPGQADYSLLFLIECKHLGRPVGIEDAEEFHSKVSQVSGKNVKAIIASPNAFTDTTVNFSRANGFGLLRYFDNADLKWVLPRSPSSQVTSQFANAEWQEAFRGIAIESYKPRHFDFYGYYDKTYTTSLRSFFLGLMNGGDDGDLIDSLASITLPPNDDRQSVPFVAKQEIELQAASILKQIGHVAGPVSLDAICKSLAESDGLSVSFERIGTAGVLGQIRFCPLEITIFRDPAVPPERERFTLAHEISHFKLGHSEYMASEYCEVDDIEPEPSKDLGIKDLIRMEWQANALASALLMPKSTFVRDFLQIARKLDLRDRGFGMVYLDSQKVNMDAFHMVANDLSAKYGVSKLAIRVRLKKLGFLNEGQMS
jgi:IrrE N-terminal-like domain